MSKNRKPRSVQIEVNAGVSVGVLDIIDSLRAFAAPDRKWSDRERSGIEQLIDDVFFLRRSPRDSKRWAESFAGSLFMSSPLAASASIAAVVSDGEFDDFTSSRSPAIERHWTRVANNLRAAAESIEAEIAAVRAIRAEVKAERKDIERGGPT